MTERIPLNPQQLDGEKVVLLQTRKRDGSWVDTPVNIAVRGERAYFRTPGKASKNKRLRNFPEVQIRPCTWSGKPTGDPAMTARLALGLRVRKNVVRHRVHRVLPRLAVGGRRALPRRLTTSARGSGRPAWASSLQFAPSLAAKRLPDVSQDTRMSWAGARRVPINPGLNGK